MARTRRGPPPATVNAIRTRKKYSSVYMTELNDIQQRCKHKVEQICNQTNSKIENIENESTYIDAFMSEERFDYWMAEYGDIEDERKRKMKQRKLMEQYTCVSTLFVYHMIMLKSFSYLTHVLTICTYIE